MTLGGLAGAIMYQVTTGSGGNFTDMMIAAGTGAVAGGLIGSGIGAPAGIMMMTGIGTAGMATAVAVGAGVGMIGAQAGYTFSAGENYNSTDMVIAAGVGGAQGALSGAAGITFPQPVQGANGMLGIATVGINVIGGVVQTGLTRLSHYEFDDPGNVPAVTVSVPVGMVGGAMDLAIAGAPTGLRPVAQTLWNAGRNGLLYLAQDQVGDWVDQNRYVTPQ